MRPLTASSSLPGEKPEGSRKHAAADASLTDLEHSGSAAASSFEMGGTSDPSLGSDAPSTAVDRVTSNLEAALAGEGSGSAEDHSDGMEHFHRLRRRMLVSTLLASTAAVPVCWLLFDLPAALSLLAGALAGLLYLVLLARSVARLGGDRRSVGKIQLLVPVVLVLASSRMSQLELVPALVGFLLYKPALLVQAYLDR